MRQSDKLKIDCLFLEFDHFCTSHEGFIRIGTKETSFAMKSDIADPKRGQQEKKRMAENERFFLQKNLEYLIVRRRDFG